MLIKIENCMECPCFILDKLKITTQHETGECVIYPYNTEILGRTSVNLGRWHTQPKIIPSWCPLREREVDDALPKSIQEALNSGDGTYRP